MGRDSVAIVGAGIVGLAVAYYLVKAGVRLTIIDRDPGGDKASIGNAGAIAVTEVVPAATPAVWFKLFRWVTDPLGPLAVRPSHVPKLIPWLVRFAKCSIPGEVERISRAIAAINSRVYEDLIPMLEDIGMAPELYRRGALTVYETERGYIRDAAEWDYKRARGISIEHLSGVEARQMEPALGPLVSRAVWTPEWSYISDPRRLMSRLIQWLGNQGVEILKGEVMDIVAAPGAAVSVAMNGGDKVSTGSVVIAAGAWSGSLARRLGDTVLLESERGYNVTLPSPGVSVAAQLIFAEHKFVATPLHSGLRIGGGAEFGGLRAEPDFRRSRALLALAQRYLPELKSADAVQWTGHRPATPDSLPVMGRSRRAPNVLYAFGHGHLGLTQSATTGRLIGDLLAQRPPTIDITPYAIDRFS